MRLPFFGTRDMCVILGGESPLTGWVITKDMKPNVTRSC